MKNFSRIAYDSDTPLLAADAQLQSAPRDKLPQRSMPPALAYQIVHDEAMLDGNPRLNMATFVTSWMDEYARMLMHENESKNLADRSEYAQTASIEQRCVNMIADLWHSPEAPDCTGISTAGSSEACMLGAVAALIRWRAAQRTGRPNFVISAACQVVWRKFALFWDVEMRTVPLTELHMTLDVERAAALCDENTFLVVGIAGATSTGLCDDMVRLSAAVDRINLSRGLSIPIHVDAASGGFVLPFTAPGEKWDFRLKWVQSISASGHKFGLVYPGVGWIVWRERRFLPESMRFEAEYLDGSISPTFNFSRPANRVLAQYYQFLRLGYDGYREVTGACMEVAAAIRSRLQGMGMEPLAQRTSSPVVAWRMPTDVNRKWTLYDLAESMRREGWLVPAYALPPELEQIVVMRVVVRQGTGIDLARILLSDMERSIRRLDSNTDATAAYRRVGKRERIPPHNFSHDH